MCSRAPGFSLQSFDKKDIKNGLKILINHLYVAWTCVGVKINILDKGCVDQVHLQNECLQNQLVIATNTKTSVVLVVMVKEPIH